MNAITNQSGGSSGASVPPSQPSTALTKFHYFKTLPTELRLAIWKLALPNSRIVEIIFNKKHKKDKQAKFQSRTPTPAILHACAESRVLGLEVYRKLTVTNCFLRTYIRWDLDLVYIDCACFYEFLSKANVRGDDSEFSRECQRIAMSEGRIGDLIYCFLCPGHRVPKSKELIVVQREDKQRNRIKRLQRLVDSRHQPVWMDQMVLA
jgi:hypothetical protein